MCVGPLEQATAWAARSCARHVGRYSDSKACPAPGAYRPSLPRPRPVAYGRFPIGLETGPSAHDGFRSLSPLLGSPGFAPGSLLAGAAGGRPGTGVDTDGTAGARHAPASTDVNVGVRHGSQWTGSVIVADGTAPAGRHS